MTVILRFISYAANIKSILTSNYVHIPFNFSDAIKIPVCTETKKKLTILYKDNDTGIYQIKTKLF